MAIDLVGKIGSMALIRREDGDIDYNIISRLGAQLRPGMVWVTSGAAEIGRIDFVHRMGKELTGDIASVKTDYSSQGQAILMAQYRQFIDARYSVRQLLVEHQHFNDAEKREHMRQFLLRCPEQMAIPIVNYNDPVSSDETRKMELNAIRGGGAEPVECVDNDETAAVIADLVQAKTLLILTSTDGIYRDPQDASTLVETISGSDPDELYAHIEALQAHCRGASRAGAGGAFFKLEYIKKPAISGMTVIIGSAKYRLDDLLDGRAPQTRIGLSL